MAEAAGRPKSTRRPGNWRDRENRASPKHVSKRVSVDEHRLLTQYADSLNVKVAQLLAPAVEDLLARAREYQQRMQSQQTVGQNEQPPDADSINSR
ncbi:hypothetical protein [Mycolicibacterium fortuitum]|uniref:hypothetical protein n=1 Tax=Mycolicibacterium fortuitum TaxID=1766 RepID=UPI000945AC92|nr:hypothetical protein [Mycolicibacterium fortuitum]MDG5769406.1 hypothetical protein [Mycolicibacterium fortuitum]MDG5780729.1 hypothetical protein [Mycolicibacterium fortuitum]